MSSSRCEKGASRTVRLNKLRRDAPEDAFYAREGVHETQGACLPWVGHDSGEGQDDPYSDSVVQGTEET